MPLSWSHTFWQGPNDRVSDLRDPFAGLLDDAYQLSYLQQLDKWGMDSQVGEVWGNQTSLPLLLQRNTPR